MSTSSTQRPLLSLCMIVKNEERFLEGCLSSVRGVVDEMIVVDTGSTDRTREIAVSFGAMVLDFPWISDFSAARNAGLNVARGEWILCLDADERLNAGQGSSLRKLLRDRTAGAFFVWVESDHDLQEGPVRHRMGYPRVFRNHPRIRFSGKVHEQIVPALEELGLSVSPSGIVIEHLGYAQGLDVVLAKAERNLAILRQDREEDPMNGYVQCQIGNSLDVLGRYDEARPEVERALGMELSESIRAAAHTLLAGIALRQGRYAEGVQHADASLAIAPTQRIGQWLRSVNLINLKRYQDALDGFRKIQRNAGPGPRGTILTANDVMIEDWKISYQCALCHEGLGHFPEAGSLFLEVHRARPEESAPVDSFLRTALQRQDFPALNRQFKLLIAGTPASARIHSTYARVLRAEGNHGRASDELRKAQQIDPKDEKLYVSQVELAISGENAESVSKIIENAKKSNVASFSLFKVALDSAVKKKDFGQALNLLRDMADTIPTQIPEDFRPKLRNLVAKLESLQTAQ